MRERSIDAPITEIRYSGPVHVRTYRRGTYLAELHLEEVIERALGSRYSFGEGWRGEADFTIRFFPAREREHAA